jgi:hypothetical protein
LQSSQVGHDCHGHRRTVPCEISAAINQDTYIKAELSVTN